MENKLVVTFGEREGGRGSKEAQIIRYKEKATRIGCIT